METVKPLSRNAGLDAF